MTSEEQFLKNEIARVKRSLKKLNECSIEVKRLPQHPDAIRLTEAHDDSPDTKLLNLNDPST